MELSSIAGATSVEIVWTVHYAMVEPDYGGFGLRYRGHLNRDHKATSALRLSLLDIHRYRLYVHIYVLLGHWH